MKTTLSIQVELDMEHVKNLFEFFDDTEREQLDDLMREHIGAQVLEGKFEMDTIALRQYVTDRPSMG